MYVYIYIYTHTHMYTYIYIYIYIERERSVNSWIGRLMSAVALRKIDKLTQAAFPHIGCSENLPVHAALPNPNSSAN